MRVAPPPHSSISKSVEPTHRPLVSKCWPSSPHPRRRASLLKCLKLSASMIDHTVYRPHSRRSRLSACHASPSRSVARSRRASSLLFVRITPSPLTQFQAGRSAGLHTSMGVNDDQNARPGSYRANLMKMVWCMGELGVPPPPSDFGLRRGARPVYTQAWT